MKKLLAILLTLAMMLSPCGPAEAHAPPATLTTITLRDLNESALVPELEEATEIAYRVLLGAQRVDDLR